jgi:hypothetical protein
MGCCADGEIIDQVARFEIVGGIHDEADAVEQILDVARRHIRYSGLDLNTGIDRLEDLIADLNQL